MPIHHGPAAWIIFHAIIIGLLTLDLGFFNRKNQVITIKKAVGWSLFWIAIAMGFCFYVYQSLGEKAALEFLTGYVVEKSLSVDNLFVFLVIFQNLKISPIYQHRLLFWGVIGAIGFRAIMIFTGSALLENFHWLIYVFGAFLIFTGIKLFFNKADEFDPQKNPLFRFVRRYFPLSLTENHNGHFLLKDTHSGKWHFTIPFLALVLIESSDVIFALDSVPAVLAITKDTYIVYTSNIFAILGLRSLFFVLENIMHRFRFLKYGLALVLLFVGLKMIAEAFLHISPLLSLLIVGGILGTSILMSFLIKANPSSNIK